MNENIVSTKEEDKPLIFISEEAINLKRDNDKFKKEIERLKKCYCNRSDCAGRLNQKNEVYDSVVQRNERAIEYIEQHNDFFLLKREVKKLLDILKGVDKNA